jgi:hypothetical protein
LVVALIAIWLVAVPRPHDEPAPAPLAAAPTADTPSGIAGWAAPQPPPSAAAPTPPSAAAPTPASDVNAHANDKPAEATVVEPFPPPKSEGPVEQYKATFQSEPRDATAQTDETAAQAAFRTPDLPAALFKSALCHQSICRIEVAWTKDRQIAYMTGFTRLLGAVGQKTAVEAQPGPDGSGEYPLTLWIQRGTQLKLPSASPPEEHAP